MQLYLGDFISNLLGLVIILAFLVLVFLYSTTWRAIGMILMVLGIVFSLTTIGEIVGIPAAIIGLTLFVWAGKRRVEE